MANKKLNVVIVGYPKSGTHWICRLVAELIECPIIGEWGFLNQDNKITESLERRSNFQCSKSHHEYGDINNVENEQVYKLVYVVRDPRDIVISGMHYFNFRNGDMQFITIDIFKRFFNKIKKILKFPRSLKSRKEIMIKAVLENKNIENKWLNPSWRKHYKPYFEDKNVIFIKYEEMLSNPLEQCKQILNSFGIEKAEKEILMAIMKQSFKVKKKILDHEDESSSRLLREGGMCYWKREFSNTEKQLFLEYLEEDFKLLEYDLV